MYAEFVFFIEKKTKKTTNNSIVFIHFVAESLESIL